MASHAQTASHPDHGEHADHPNYWKIYWILLVLLLISFVGPFFGHRVVTLITAFGIAVVKAYLVAKNFMHLNLQPRFIGYVMATTLVFMVLLYAGAAPDVMKHQGNNWQKQVVAQEQAPAHH
jgi:caa(3)-type oxidase subunit IV